MTLPKTLRGFLLLGLILLAGAEQPPKEQKDPQSVFEPRSGPGVGQKFLEQFVGDWQVVKTFYPRSGDPVQTKGRCRQIMVQGGRFLQSDFTFEGAGGKTTGTGLIGFEADSGLFTSVWIDSRSTRMSLRRSRDRFDGKEIVLFSQSLEGEKDARRSRTVTRLENEGRVILHRQFVPGPDGKERPIMELKMTRVRKEGDAAHP
jgi:hypothetical protein